MRPQFIVWRLCLILRLPIASLRRLFRPWDRRLDFSGGATQSCEDAELLIDVPFTGNVKLRSISVTTLRPGRSRKLGS